MENQDIFSNPNDDNWMERQTVFETTMKLLECHNDKPVGTWDFFYESVEPEAEDPLQQWAKMIDLTRPFVEEFMKVFEYSFYDGYPYTSLRVRIMHDDSLLNKYPPVIYNHFESFTISLKNLDSLKPIVLEHLKQYKKLDDKRYNSICLYIDIPGKVTFTYPNDYYSTSDYFSKLFEIEIRSGVAFSIKVRNFAFLPNHPILRKKQYELWAINAPKLAHCINVISNTPNLRLNIEDRRTDGYGSFDSDHTGYLFNISVSGVDWDEFYIPYELLGSASEDN